MIEEIDLKIGTLLKCRDTEDVKQHAELRALVCSVISKAYFLQYIILSEKKITEQRGDQFFTANAAVNRHFRDSNLDEVADIYNELCIIAEPYLHT